MLPDHDDLPTRLGEHATGVGVPCPCALNLGPPELTVCARGDVVLEATVPEAAVHEHRDAGGAEHDICTASESGERRTVDSKAEASTVQRRPEGELRCCVSRPVAAHRGPNRGG